MMADYDCCEPRSQTVTPSLDIPVSTSQQLPIATSCESIWEGWTQTPPASTCALMEQLQQLGGCTNGSKSVNLCQPDLLSSWLMSGFQSAGTSQQHCDEGTGMIAYQDEFSRMNIMSCSSSSEQQGPAAWSDATHQLYVLPCSSSAQNTCNIAEEEQSTQFLRSPPSAENPQSKVSNGNQQILQQMTATELCSRTSSSSPPAVLSSYGQMIQQLVGQFDNSSYWASSTVTSSSQQSSDCSGVMPFTGQQIDQSNHNNDEIILRHQISNNLKPGFDGNSGLPSSDADVSGQMHMYAELHGLLTRSLEVPAHGPADHQSAICSNNPAVSTAEIRNYADQSSWTQFGVDPMANASVGPSQSGLVGIQHSDQTMFEASNITPNDLSTAAKRDDLSPSSAGTDISTINNLKAATTGTNQGPGHHPLPHGLADLDHDSSEGLQRRTSSRGSEQVADNGISAEESVKRSSIVRCVWEQNIAQLQVANVPSDHHRNLWQMQSQALFGRIPNNLLLGSSSNSGSVDMHAAVGPALNTNGRPRARRGSATDPQSVYARHRRERIKDRLKVLQHLVPNGAKVDIVTMLEEAINYVKYLQVQVRLLSSDEQWIYADTTYNGVDVSMGMHAGLLNPQA